MLLVPNSLLKGYRSSREVDISQYSLRSTKLLLGPLSIARGQKFAGLPAKKIFVKKPMSKYDQRSLGSLSTLFLTHMQKQMWRWSRDFLQTPNLWTSKYSRTCLVWKYKRRQMDKVMFYDEVHLFAYLILPIFCMEVQKFLALWNVSLDLFLLFESIDLLIFWNILNLKKKPWWKQNSCT